MVYVCPVKSVIMPDKEEQSLSGSSSPAIGASQLEEGSNDSQASSQDSGPVTVNNVHSQTSHNESARANSLLLSSQKCLRNKVPKLSSGPQARERLKFILGASEDNSSDEEPLATKPPSCTPLPSTSTPSCSPQNVEISHSTSGIK